MDHSNAAPPRAAGDDRAWRGATLCSKCHRARLLDSLRGIEHLHDCSQFVPILLVRYAVTMRISSGSRSTMSGPRGTARRLEAQMRKLTATTLSWRTFGAQPSAVSRTELASTQGSGSGERKKGCGCIRHRHTSRGQGGGDNSRSDQTERRLFHGRGHWPQQSVMLVLVRSSDDALQVASSCGGCRIAAPAKR